jgi:hypothetical protein
MAIDRQELPSSGHAPQLDIATVVKTRARADDQITHGTRYEDFAGAGLAEDPRRDMYCDSPDVGVEQFALASVNAGANLDAQLLGISTQPLGAADSLRRTLERDEMAVAGALHDCAAESLGEFGGDFSKAVE